MSGATLLRSWPQMGYDQGLVLRPCAWPGGSQEQVGKSARLIAAAERAVMRV